MPVYKQYQTNEYTNFLKQPYSNNYGISEERIADWFMAQGGARPVINSYGVNRANLLSTYIPKLKEKLGGYVFFLCYTVVEGGGAGNWINHYLRDTASTGLQCLIDDCDYLLKISNEHHPVALSAPELFARAVEDEPGKAQAVYDSMSNNMIGKIYMPSTMAGNAWVYCTKWCTQNQGAVPYVYFGNPYDDIINMLKNAGADPFKLGEQSPAPLKPNEGSTRDGKQGDFIADFATILNKLKEGVEDIFNNQLVDLSTNNYYYTNQVLTITRTYNNSVSVDLNNDYLNDLFKSIESLLQSQSKNKNNGSNNNVPSEQQKTPEQNQGQKTNIADKVNNLRALQGQTIGDGQCYALASWYLNSITNGYHISYSLGTPPAGFAIGDTLRAANIGSGWNWGSIGWTVKNPSIDNIKVGDIFSVAANFGGIWQTGYYGHVGIVTGIDGDYIEITDQNFAGYPVNIRRYPKTQFIQGITSLISPP